MEDGVRSRGMCKFRGTRLKNVGGGYFMPLAKISIVKVPTQFFSNFHNLQNFKEKNPSVSNMTSHSVYSEK